MKILRKSGDYNIIVNQENDFQTNLGWEEGMDIFEDEILSTIINPIDNYETVRYIPEPYNVDLSGTTVNQCDIWYKFYFIDSGDTYNNGLDYSLVGIAPKDNAHLIKATTESYFRLEFFKTPNNEPPTRINRKLVFSKNLSLPLGEKFYYNPLKQNIHIPVFMGSNYRNKENTYLFWFQDDTVLSDSTLSGNTFFMSAKFLNSFDGSVLDFTTTGLTNTQQVIEERDMYYKVVIDKTNYTYKVYHYTGGETTEDDLVGSRYDNAIIFYEKRLLNVPVLVPSASPIPSPSHTPTRTLTPSPTPTHTPTSSIGATASPTPTSTVTPSQTSSIGASLSPTPTSTITPTPTMTVTPTISESPTPSVTPTSTITPTPTISESPTPSVTPTSTITPTPTISESPTPTPSVSIGATPSPTPTMTPTLTPPPTAYCSYITISTSDDTTNYFLRYTPYGGTSTDVFFSSLLADTNTPGYYIYHLCSSSLPQLGFYNGSTYDLVTVPSGWDFNINTTTNTCTNDSECI
jgi:hypothetical protein